MLMALTAAGIVDDLIFRYCYCTTLSLNDKVVARFILSLEEAKILP